VRIALSDAGLVVHEQWPKGAGTVQSFGRDDLKAAFPSLKMMTREAGSIDGRGTTGIARRIFINTRQCLLLPADQRG
jgi:hypothetical protein